MSSPRTCCRLQEKNPPNTARPSAVADALFRGQGGSSQRRRHLEENHSSTTSPNLGGLKAGQPSEPSGPHQQHKRLDGLDGRDQRYLNDELSG